ncbi:MAG: hypothetical protein ACYC0B_07170 [Gemmatimonadaceae bacterium]
MPRDERDEGFAAWRDSVASKSVVAPYAMMGGRFDVLIQSAVAREGTDRIEHLRRGVAACAPLSGLSTDEQRRLVEDHAWREFDAAVEGMPLIAITIAPTPARRAYCAGVVRAELGLLEHGIRFGIDTLADPRHDAWAVEILVGEERIRPALVARAPVTKVAPESYIGTDGLHALRVYLAFDALDGLAPGTPNLPVLRLQISTIDSAPETVEIPQEVIEDILREMLPWRARRLATASRGHRDLPVSLPEPRDALLLAAHRRYLAGDYADATATALARLDARQIRSADRTSARMQAGLTFAGHGDEAAARMLLGDAIAHEPCLTLPAAAPSAFRALLEDVRPSARCEAVSGWQVARMGLIPGRAQRRLHPERRGAGFFPLVITTGLGVTSILMHKRADEVRRQYEQNFVDPAGAFARANEAHRKANRVGAATYAVWGGSIIQAILHERRLARGTAEVRDYGANAARPVRVGAASQGLGLSISFF